VAILVAKSLKIASVPAVQWTYSANEDDDVLAGDMHRRCDPSTERPLVALFAGNRRKFNGGQLAAFPRE
jgi:hypothetical protein